MEWKMFLIGMAGLLGLYLMGTVLFRPLRFLIRLAAWSMLGLSAGGPEHLFGYWLPHCR